MKKFFSFLLITILLVCSFKYTPSFANPVPLPNWSDPGITEIINLSDLTGWMQNGGVFDVSNFQDAEEFLDWYFKIRVPYKDDNGEISFAPAFGNNTYNLSPGNMSYVSINNPRGIISNSFREHTGYGRSFQSDYENYSLNGGNLIDMPFQLLDRRSIGNFNLYKYDSLTNYLHDFELEDPVPDSDYIFLSNINNFYVYSSDYSYCDFLDPDNNFGWYSAGNGTFYPYTPTQPLSTCSFTTDGINGDFLYHHTLNSSGFTYNGLFSSISSSIISINLTVNQDNSVSVTYDNVNMVPNNQIFSGVPSQESSYRGTRPTYNPNGTGNYLNEFINLGGYSSNGSYYSNFASSYSNLTVALNNIFRCFCNVNIYVNGDAWVLVNQDSNAPEFPDVVGGEELPVTTWPLYLPKAPAYISGTGIINAIQRAINTDGTFDFGDLKDEITDGDGNPFPINDWEEVPFGDTVPNPNPDDDSVTGTPTPPIPDPDIIPIIPEPIHNAFQGTTILAELVDATQTALPSELITVFWGIVFILFILGIIKILHK